MKYKCGILFIKVDKLYNLYDSLEMMWGRIILQVDKIFSAELFLLNVVKLYYISSFKLYLIYVYGFRLSLYLDIVMAKQYTAALPFT